VDTKERYNLEFKAEVSRTFLKTVHYEEKKASSQSLSFTILESRLKEKAGIEKNKLGYFKDLKFI